MDALSRVDTVSLEEFCVELLAVRDRGGMAFVVGNGGSAATSSHMAVDLMLGSGLASPPLRVLALAENSCIVTATGNDISFDEIFSRQIETLGQTRDLLIVLTASGNSQNILNAVEVARARGMRTVALTGFDGGRIAALVDVHVHIPTQPGAYGPVEDAHLAINHVLTSYLRDHVANAQVAPTQEVT